MQYMYIGDDDDDYRCLPPLPSHLPWGDEIVSCCPLGDDDLSHHKSHPAERKEEAETRKDG